MQSIVCSPADMTGVAQPPESPWCGERKGTSAGYRLHLRLKETPCDACRAAHRERLRVWRANRPSRAVEPDWASVERAVTGVEIPKLTAHERRLAIERLLARGKSNSETARTLRISRRTVERHRKAIQAGQVAA